MRRRRKWPAPFIRSPTRSTPYPPNGSPRCSAHTTPLKEAAKMSDHIKVVNMTPFMQSGETNQDSEPNVAVNPVSPLEIAATAFTPSPNVNSVNSPIYYSNDGGNTWTLLDIIGGTPVRDQTLRFSSTGGT